MKINVNLKDYVQRDEAVWGNLDDITKTGIYRVMSNYVTGGYPQGWNIDGSALIHIQAGTASHQILMVWYATTAPNMFIRKKSSAGWSDWWRVTFNS